MQANGLPAWFATLLQIGGLFGYLLALLAYLDKRKEKRDLATKKTAGLELLGWTLEDRLELERWKKGIEKELEASKEVHELLERLMANVLHSPHRPELDRLLEKIDRGRILTDAEFMFASEWLQEISTDPDVTKGEQTAAAILLALLNSKYKRLRAEEEETMH